MQERREEEGVARVEVELDGVVDDDGGPALLDGGDRLDRHHFLQQRAQSKCGSVLLVGPRYRNARERVHMQNRDPRERVTRKYKTRWSVLIEGGCRCEAAHTSKRVFLTPRFPT